MSELNTAAGNILNRLVAAPTFHPGNVDLFTDWNLQAGDIVTVSADGDNYALPIYNMRLKWTGQTKVEAESTGNPKREPPPANERKSYGAAAGGYGGTKANSDVLHEAGLFVDPETGVWAYASQQGSNYALGASFNVQAGLISQEVTRATAAEGTLSSRVTQTETAITQKVSAGDIASTINQTAQSVLISASKIDLDGYVTANELATYIADIATLTVQDLTAGAIECSGVETSALVVNNDAAIAGTLEVSSDATMNDVTAGDVTVDSLTVDGYSVAPDNLVASIGPATTDSQTGGVTIPWKYADGSDGTDITFNIADTVFYQQAVSAAYTSGQNSIQMKKSWSSSTATISRVLSGGTINDIKVTLSAKAGIDYNESAHTYTASAQASADDAVRASDTKNSGTEAYTAGITKGQDDVVINKGGWDTGKKKIEFTKSVGTASTKSVELSGSVGSYDSTNKKYVVSVYDGGSRWTGLDVDVDATDAFNAGKNRYWRAGSHQWGYTNNGGATWNMYYQGTMFRSYDEA